MARIAALIVRDTTPIRFAGLDLAARAERLVRRAGIEHVQIVDDHYPFAEVPVVDLLLVLPERVIVERSVITDLVRRDIHLPEDAAIVVDAAGESTGLVLLSLRATERIRAVPRLRSGLRRLGVEANVRSIRVAPSGRSRLSKDQIPERGARMARRDDRAYREYVREEQRS